MAVAAGLAGVGAGLYGLSQGSPASKVNTYGLQNQAGADIGAFGGIQNLGQFNTYGQNLGQFGNLASQLGQGNPYAGLYQQGANQAGGLYQGAGLGAYGAGGALGQTGLGQLGNVQALMNMGFDPQSALYARTQQQNAQQNAAQLEASGVAQTPYGQSVASQANNNFNIDWQNQQLQRALMGAQGAGSLMGNIGGALGQGQALQNAGAGMYLQGAGLPYGTAQGITGDTMGGLTQLGQFGAGGANMQNQQIQDYLQYLGQGNQNAYTQLQQANLAFNQSQAMSKGLGQSVAGLGAAWGGMGQPYGTGYTGPQAQGNQYAGTSPFANYLYNQYNNPNLSGLS